MVKDSGTGENLSGQLLFCHVPVDKVDPGVCRRSAAGRPDLKFFPAAAERVSRRECEELFRAYRRGEGVHALAQLSAASPPYQSPCNSLLLLRLVAACRCMGLIHAGPVSNQAVSCTRRR